MSRRAALLSLGSTALPGSAPAALARDTRGVRWRRLSPFVTMQGPADDVPRPAVLLFHGCGGVQGHLAQYAEAAARVGVRAFVVDSYAPRGWSRAYGMAFVCSGARFHGAARAGDVLAAIHGVSQRPDVDASRIALAGWSHGSWAIMDLLTMPLGRSGEAGLADASAEDLAGLKSLFLAYPYVGPGARSRRLAWRRSAPTLALIAGRDHLGPPSWSEAIYARERQAGCAIESWLIPEATHAFDQPSETSLALSPMRRDPELGRRAQARFAEHLARTLA